MTKNNKKRQNDKMTKMTKKIFQEKKNCQKKNFTKKSIKNCQKLNKEQNDNQPTNRPTDQPTDIAACRVA